MSRTQTYRLTAHDAIAYAEREGVRLGKYADPTEDAREGLTVAEAREIAAEDPSLVYVMAPVETRDGVVIGRACALNHSGSHRITAAAGGYVCEGCTTHYHGSDVAYGGGRYGQGAVASVR